MSVYACMCISWKEHITNGTRSSLTLRHSKIKITFNMLSHSYFAQTTFIQKKKCKNCADKYSNNAAG